MHAQRPYSERLVLIFTFTLTNVWCEILVGVPCHEFHSKVLALMIRRADLLDAS